MHVFGLLDRRDQIPQVVEGSTGVRRRRWGRGSASEDVTSFGFWPEMRQAMFKKAPEISVVELAALEERIRFARERRGLIVGTRHCLGSR